MGYFEIKNAMQAAAAQQTKYNKAACEGIMNAIFNYYMVTINYYAEDCINTFNRFLNTGILSFSK